MASIEALLGVLRASDYGARGGGNRDDAPGIIQALAVAAVPGGAAPAVEGQNLSGGIVTLDAGVLYRIGRTVNIPSNVELVIPTGAIVRPAPGFVGPMFAATGAVGLRVTGGGVVDANSIPGSARFGGAQADAFVFTNCTDGNMDGPIVQSAYNNGVSLIGCTRMQLEIQSVGCGGHGIYHSGSTYCGGTVIARDNGQRNAGSSGLVFDAGSTDNSYQLTATDTRAPIGKTQQYGMFEVPASGCDRNVLSASSLAGNAAGAIAVVGASSGYLAGNPVAGSVNDASIAAGGLSNASLGVSVARANLFVNGGFEIAQRPGAPWTANGAFTLDYWRQDLIAAGSTISTSQITSTIGSPGKSAQIVYTHVAASGYRFTQPVRLGDNLDQLRGKQITFGFQVKSTVAGTVRCVANGTILGIVNGAYNVGVAEETILLTVAIPANETSLFLGVQFDAASATVELNDARLALGAVLPTYAPLPSADDLARCMRYYEILAAPNAWAASGYLPAANQVLYWSFPFKVQKGATPTVTVTGVFLGQTTIQTAPSVDVIDARSYRFNITSNGAGIVLMHNNGQTGQIAAEWNP